MRGLKGMRTRINAELALWWPFTKRHKNSPAGEPGFLRTESRGSDHGCVPIPFLEEHKPTWINSTRVALSRHAEGCPRMKCWRAPRIALPYRTTATRS